MLPGIHPSLGRVAVQCTRCDAKARVRVRVGVTVAAAVGAIARRSGGSCHQCLTPTLHIVAELIGLLAQYFVESLDQHEDSIVHERSLSLERGERERGEREEKGSECAVKTQYFNERIICSSSQFSPSLRGAEQVARLITFATAPK